LSAATTIAAIASPPGGGARGIVRLSGPRAGAIVRATWRGPAPDLARRGLAAGRFDDGRGTQPALLLWMPGPGSYTGEDVAELHLPGSPPLLRVALARVLELGAASAEPGEFTRRAFHAGRIDLTRAEGVLELVRARNAAEARAARQLLLGGLARRVDALRAELDDLRALCEASLDFDAADTGHVDPAEIRARAGSCVAAVRAARRFEAARARASGTPRVALCGAPNAGKSALFNALLGRPEAIESDHPGTTRDALEGALELPGAQARLLDMPGFDAAAAGVDRAAQDLATERLSAADLCLWVVDAAGPQRGRLAEERARLPEGAPALLAWSKTDLASAGPPPDPAAVGMLAVVPVSARTGAGLEALRAALARALAPGGGDAPTLEREVALRHDQGLAAAERELLLGLERWSAGAPLDLLCEHLRAAGAGLDALCGRTTSEDLLDRIFARFCLGK
jgi:tRNA modification GTPase